MGDYKKEENTAKVVGGGGSKSSVFPILSAIILGLVLMIGGSFVQAKFGILDGYVQGVESNDALSVASETKPVVVNKRIDSDKEVTQVKCEPSKNQPVPQCDLSKIDEDQALSRLIDSVYAYRKNIKRGKVVGDVGGTPIYQDDYLSHAAAALNASSLSEIANLKDEQKELIIKDLYVRSIFFDRAVKEKFFETQAFKSFLKSKIYELVTAKYLDALALQGVTDEEVRKLYDARLAEASGKLQFKASHILVKDESEALSVYSDMLDEIQNDSSKKPAIFAKFAREKSLDTNSAKNGGQLGDYFIEGTMLPVFEEKLKSIDVGSISSPFKTRFGYHIVYLQERGEAKPLPFEDLSFKIRSVLMGQYVRGVFEKEVSDKKITLSK